MMSKIALCADSQCLNDPVTLGLKGERILDQTWIVPFVDALIARKYLREHDVAETWVVSNDTMLSAQPSSQAIVDTVSPKRTTVVTAPPRCAMPWISETLQHFPAALATRASNVAAVIVP